MEINVGDSCFIKGNKKLLMVTGIIGDIITVKNIITQEITQVNKNKITTIYEL